MNKKNKISLNLNRLAPAISFFIVAVLFLVILAIENILGPNNRSILRSDLYAQYVPFITNFLNCINGDGSIWYSFANYLGSGNILNVAYYDINPFNVLFLIPFLSIENAVIILITVKMALAAACFQFYADKNLTKNIFISITASCFYGLSGFVLILHYNIMWLDIIYMLPILVHLIIRLIKTGKFMPLIFAYTYIFIVNFYMAYMAGVFTGIFYIAYIIYYNNGSFKNFIKKYLMPSLKFALSVIISAGMCAFLLLSTVGFLYSHIAEDNIAFKTMTITIPDLFNTFFVGQMTTYNNEVPYFYCGIIVLPLVIVFFINKKIALKDKLLWGAILTFYFVGCIFTPLYAFLHAFDYPNFHAFRFAFVVVFALLSIGCKSIEYLDKDELTKIKIISISLIVFYSIMMVYQKYSLETGTANSQNGLLINAAFIIAWLVLLTIYKLKENVNKKALISASLILMMGELLVNSVLCFKVINVDMENITDSEFNQWYYSEKEVIETIKANDNSLYRTFVDNEWCHNAANLFGFNSINTFSSSDNYELRMALSKLGLSVSNREIEAHTLLPAFDSLFAVKYKAKLLDYDSCEAKQFTKNNYVPGEIYINDKALSFGYMVREDILNYQLTTNCFNNLENLCNTMTGLDKDVYSSISDCQVDVINMNYFYDGAGMVFYPSSSAANTGAVQFTVSSNSPYTYGYFYFDEPELYGMSPYVYSDQYGILTTMYLTMGGAYKCDNLTDSTAILGINSPEGQSLDYRIDGLYFAKYNESEFEEIYDNLAMNQLNITSYTGDTISGMVTATEDKNVLFTTIPYDPEWVVLVDGVPTTIYRVVGDAFIAVKLTPGEHRIKFMYLEKYSTEGLIVSFVSIMIFVMLLLVNIVVGKKKVDK